MEYTKDLLAGLLAERLVVAVECGDEAEVRYFNNQIASLTSETPSRRWEVLGRIVRLEAQEVGFAVQDSNIGIVCYGVSYAKAVKVFEALID